jgi:hypothetical protein
LRWLYARHPRHDYRRVGVQTTNDVVDGSLELRALVREPGKSDQQALSPAHRRPVPGTKTMMMARPHDAMTLMTLSFPSFPFMVPQKRKE